MEYEEMLTRLRYILAALDGQMRRLSGAVAESQLKFEAQRDIEALERAIKLVEKE